MWVTHEVQGKAEALRAFIRWSTSLRGAWIILAKGEGDDPRRIGEVYVDNAKLRAACWEFLIDEAAEDEQYALSEKLNELRSQQMRGEFDT